MSFIKNNWWGLFLGILLLAAVWIFLTAYVISPDQQEQTYAVPQVGFFAPDFELVNLEGESIRLSSLRGQPVLINVWASWCRPCQYEMPDMEAAYQKYKSQGFTILAVNATNQDSIADVQAFVENQGLQFPILLDYQGQVSSLYRVQALPSSFFVSPDGRIQDIVIGGPMSAALLETRIEKLME